MICSELTNVLKKHRNEKIMLVAHSMGSIIAYDVLTLDASDVPIDTFVTIGSPLGLPIIKSRIVAERRQDPSQKGILKTPENIGSHWYNLADLRDKIAINYTLQDDFKENTQQIGPVDKIVTNDYTFEDQKNPHKSYGYLRTPEMAEIISGFINGTQ
jgi:alpha-beta hydrolase superfamily lysophospholipase